MKERTKFVLEWERRWREAEGGPVNTAELCRIFGVSRQTGYKWVERYRGAGFSLAGVGERSRRRARPGRVASLPGACASPAASLLR
ncbi:MAG TPA: helix-turn-helix domain-containing protein [Kofleriaceae bacterium]|nr:helix-turn-helix domain-containing protein [Kofleriaceae bacterium]